MYTHQSWGLFLKFLLGRGLFLSLSLGFSFSFHHTHTLLAHHIWVHPGTKRHVNQTPLKQRTNVIIFTRIKRLFARRRSSSLSHVPIYSKKDAWKLTSPGLTHPTAGDTVRGAPAGTTNSNDVGPTSTIGPEPILGTGWVNSFALVCELMTSIWAGHVSDTAVAFILITECESSSGGRTPTARQWSLNSRPIPVLQVRSNSYSWKNK